jgi:hypothetical protein
MKIGGGRPGDVEVVVDNTFSLRSAGLGRRRAADQCFLDLLPFSFSEEYGERP